MRGIFRLAEDPSVSLEGLCYVELSYVRWTRLPSDRCHTNLHSRWPDLNPAPPDERRARLDNEFDLICKPNKNIALSHFVSSDQGTFHSNFKPYFEYARISVF
jgi:hypothetical protein